MQLVTIFLRMMTLCVLAFFMVPATASAQSSWVQIEARPTLGQAEARARAWAGLFDNVNGFALPTGWYAIALGPYAPLQAEAELARLRARGAVPPDSFLADGSDFRQQFWPVGGAVVPQAVAPAPDALTPVAQPPAIADETLAQARAGERALDAEARRDLQRALEWEGFYQGAIDGLFGPGTRRSMANWQAASGFEATGVLTTAQRAALVEGWRGVLNELGMTPVVDTQAGIEIAMPAGLVAFERYEAPFARYTGDAGTAVYLISQSGGRDTLAALYEVIQTLEIVPVDGPRQLSRNSFRIEGRDDRRVTNVFAELTPDGVKGYVLVWDGADERRRGLVLSQMRASFQPLPGAVLPDSAGTPEAQNRDLLAGLAIRRPERGVSGFYVGDAGAVLTAAGPLEGCGRVTIGEDLEAEIGAEDAGLGVALLTPRARLAPLAVARFAGATPRLGSEIAVAGYSFGGILGAPTLSFGSLEDIRSLEGDERRDRISIRVEDGDAGGPVLDEAGRVLGLLLPRDNGSARSLPEDVNMTADSAALLAFLDGAGINVRTDAEAAPLAAFDLERTARDMTVQVNCWR